MIEFKDPCGRRMLHHPMRHLNLFPDLTWTAHFFKVNLHLWNSQNSIGCNCFTEALVNDVAKSSMPDI